jgi:hypothetical protein
MIEVTSSIKIDRDAPSVFAYIADMSNNPAWQHGQQSCVWTSEPPHGLGSTYDQVAKFVGTTITSSFEVTEFDDGHLIRITTSGGTMPIDVTRTVTPIGADRCEIGAVVRGEPSGILAMLGPLMRRMVESSVRKDYRQLKDNLETA